MAVHNEHSIRSFPGFSEAVNFEDDDYDDEGNNFIISLEDSGDEDAGQSVSLTSVSASADQAPFGLHNTTQDLEIGTQLTAPCSFDVQNIYTVSNSDFSSEAYNKHSTNQQSVPSSQKNIQNEDRQNVCNISEETQWGGYGYDVVTGSKSGSALVSNTGSEINDQKNIVSTVSFPCGGNGALVSARPAVHVKDSCRSHLKPPLPKFTHSENHKFKTVKESITHDSVSKQGLPVKSSQLLPEMHLEIINVNKKHAGVLSEPSYLTAPDNSLPHTDKGPIESIPFNKTNNDSAVYFVSSENQHSVLFNMHSASYLPSHSVPKLSGPYLVNIEPEMKDSINNNQISNSASENLFHTSGAKINCTCIMCYKGHGITVWQPDSEEPALTEEEKLLIMMGPTKRKRAIKAAAENRKKPLLHGSVINITPQSLSAIPSNNLKQTQSLLGNIKNSLKFCSDNPAVNPTKHSDTQERHCSDVTIQSKSCDARGQEAVKADFCSRHKLPSSLTTCGNSNILTSLNKSYLHCQTTVIPGSCVVPLATTAPGVKSLFSIPVLKSHPAKVFLKPSEEPEKRLPAMSFVPELSCSYKSCLSSADKELSPVATCKEAPQISTSSSTISGPPTYKIIYVSPDQVLVCPSQTNTTVKSVSASSQPQITKSNTQHATLVKQSEAYIQTSNEKSLDTSLRIHPSNTVPQSSHICMNKSGDLNLSTNSCMKSTDKQQELRRVLKNAEKIDISRPGEVLIKLKQKSDIYDPKIEISEGSQMATKKDTVASVSNNSSSMISLLKNFKMPQVSSKESTSLPQLCVSTTSCPLQMTTPVQSPVTRGSLELTQTLMCLIKSHFQEQTSRGNEKVLVNVVKGLKTPEYNSMNNLKKILPHKPKESERILKSHEGEQILKSHEGGKSEENGIHIIEDPSALLPQEGLPSTYIEDWIKQGKSYAAEHIQDSSSVSGSQDVSTAISNKTKPNTPKAYSTSFADNAEAHILHRPQNKIDARFSGSEIHEERESHVASTCESLQRHFNSSNCAPFLDHQKLTESETVDSGACHLRTHRHLDQSFTSNTSSETIQSHIQSTPMSAQWSSLSKQIPCQTQSSSSSSTVTASSKGIKLKIKLNELGKNKVKYKHFFQSYDQNVALQQTKDDFYVQKKIHSMAEQSQAGPDEYKKQTNSTAHSNRTETAEEMFQRFQEQAVQEVFNAQMGVGYISRSLRPGKVTMAFLDKQSDRLGIEHSNKKISSEDNAHEGTKQSGDSDTCHVFQTEQQPSKGSMQNKSNIRNKRRLDEGADKEVKVKYPKLSIRDYPNLKQDCSITNRKRLFCTDILAAHKVYVKFNTFENLSSGRSFLVPFFNIGGTRTQFDVEDMEYINKAVMEFEKEERSCARHLLFYTREGQKAAFLRRETQFQTSHIQEKNYKKCSFILEGFRRDTKKHAEMSPDHWKVDNSIDIEIDRAEIDNDAEMEFDESMNSAIGGQGVDIGSVKNKTFRYEMDSWGQSKDRLHDPASTSNHGAYPALKTVTRSKSINHESLSGSNSEKSKNNIILGIVNREEKVATGFEFSNVQTEDMYHTEHGTVTSVPDAITYTESVLCPVEASSPTEKIGLLLPKLQHEAIDGNKASDTPHKDLNASSALKVQMMANEYSNESNEQVSYSSEVKQEKLDNGYGDEGCTQISRNSLYFSSSHTSNQCKDFPDKCISVKQEPVDEYFDSILAGVSSTELLKVDAYNETSEHVDDFSGSQIVHSKTSASQKTPLNEFINCTVDKEVSTVNNKTGILNQQLSFASNSQSSHKANVLDVLPDPNVESYALPLDTAISSRQVTDSTTSTKRDFLKNNTLESSLSGIKNVDSHLNSVEDISMRTLLTEELSSPDSPLPSSTMSESSEVSASSDIDEHVASSESECSSFSLTSLSLPEGATESGGRENKHNSTHNKITSLVESLKHRLTQDTPTLPTCWLSNTSLKNMQLKTKRLKASRKQKFSVSSHPIETISSNSNSIYAAQVSTECQTKSPAGSTTQTFFENISNLEKMRPEASAVVTPPSASLALKSHQQSDHSASLTSPVPNTIDIMHKSSMLLPVKQPEEAWNDIMDHAGALHTYYRCDGDFSSSGLLSADKVRKEVIESQMEDQHEFNDDVDFCEEDFQTKHEGISDDKAIHATGYAVEKKNRLYDSVSNLNRVELLYTKCAANDKALKSDQPNPIDFEIEVGREDLPEMAMSLHPVLPLVDADTEVDRIDIENCNSEFNIKHMQCHSNISRKRERHSLISSPRTDGTDKKNLTKSEYIKLCEKSTDRERHRHREGSVASYLCQKFSFVGESSKIRGPRLLHLPSNRKTLFQETSKQNHHSPSMCEPISTAELSRTPTVDEIFGASKENETTKDGSNKTLSELPVHEISARTNSCINTKQKALRTHFNKVQVAKKRTSQKKKRKVTGHKANFSNVRAIPIKLSISSSDVKHQSAQRKLSKEIRSFKVPTELRSPMQLCKVVLTKLEKLDVGVAERISESVFIIKEKENERNMGCVNDQETGQNLSRSFSDCSSKPNRKIVKRKRKKIVKAAKRNRLKPKRDIVDYYTSMLENLQRKAQQLEEETRKKTEESTKEKFHLTETCENIDERKNPINIGSNSEEMERSCDKLNGSKISEETKKESLYESSTLNADDSFLAVTTACVDNDVSVDSLKTNEKDGQINWDGEFFDTKTSGDKSEKSNQNEGADLTNREQPVKDEEDPHTDTNISQSSWPDLQKLCDETVFDEESTGYMQTIDAGICFTTPGINEATFEKKDVMLGSSISDKLFHVQTRSSSEKLHETEDTEGCLEGCSDEHERDHIDEVEMLLGLDIQKSTSFSHDEQEASSRNPVSPDISSEIIHTNYIFLSERIKSSNTRTADVSAINQNTVPACIPNVITDLKEKETKDLDSSRSRNLQVLPSWDRLLGNKYLDTGEQLHSSCSSYLPLEEPKNNGISSVIGQNFKFKFKLPTGILSRTIKMSQNRGKVFKEDVLQNNSDISQEVAANSPQDQTHESSTGHNVCRMHSDCSFLSPVQTVQSISTSLASDLPETKLKLNPLTLTAIQKVKAEFLLRRKKERKAKCRTKNVPRKLCSKHEQNSRFEVQVSEANESPVLFQESVSDSFQKLQHSCAVSDHNNCECAVVISRNRNCSSALEAIDNTGTRQQCSYSTVINQPSQAFDTQINFPEAVSHVSGSSTATALHGTLKRQGRKDGIFSSIDLLQELVDVQTSKQASESSASREAEVGKNVKTNLIDISKLKLKLNPLVSNTVKARAAQTGTDTMSTHHADKQSVVSNEESLSDQQVKDAESDSLDQLHVRQPNEHVLNLVSMSETLLKSPCAEVQSHKTLSECRPPPQLNAAKLCSFLKNFHRNASISSSVRKSLEIFPDAGAQNKVVETLDQVACTTSLQFPKETSKTSTDSLNQGAEDDSPSEVNESKVPRGMRRAKEKAKQKILTSSCVKVAASVKLDVGKKESVLTYEKLKDEDKTGRSVFDCLSNVPLDVWEDK